MFFSLGKQVGQNLNVSYSLKLLCCSYALFFHGTSNASNSLRKTIDRKSCELIVNEKLPAYKKLYNSLKASTKKNLTHPIIGILTMQKKDCRSLDKRKQLQIGLGSHSKKIGILLPSNHSFHTPIISRSLSYAVKTYFKEKNLKIQKHATVKRYSSSIKSLERSVAELIFHTGVSVIIGGITKAHEAYLSLIGQKLEIPVILTRPKQDESLIDKQIFHVGPSHVGFASYFMSFLHKQGIQRIAILHPKDSHLSLIQSIKTVFKQKSAVSPIVQHYLPNSFASIQSSLKDLFKLKPTLQGEQLHALIEDKKITSDAATTNIAYSTTATIEAILILDNFKNARHIISVMKYLNVPSMLLIGNQQWRSSELFHPPEPMLNRSFFFDYVGNYSNLPFGLNKKSHQNGWFISVEQSEALDLKLIMLTAIDAAHRALEAKSRPRYQLFRNLQKLKPADPGFFKEKRLFDRRNNSNWPFYIFALSKDKLKKVQVATKNQGQ